MFLGACCMSLLNRRITIDWLDRNRLTILPCCSSARCACLRSLTLPTPRLVTWTLLCRRSPCVLRFLTYPLIRSYLFVIITMFSSVVVMSSARVLPPCRPWCLLCYGNRPTPVTS